MTVPTIASARGCKMLVTAAVADLYWCTGRIVTLLTAPA
jgi:hypothetical protein